MNSDVTLKIGISTNNAQCVNLQVQDKDIRVKEVNLQLVKAYVSPFFSLSASACLCARMSPLVHRDTLRDERSQPSGLNDQETEAQRGVSAWERPSVFQNSLPSPVCMLLAKHTFVLCSRFLHKQYAFPRIKIQKIQKAVD